MAKNPEPDKTSQAEGKTPQAERSIDREREEAQEPGTPASSGTPASKEAARPKSPREFIHERMRQLDKKGP
jgi:hypothetical protein